MKTKNKKHNKLWIFTVFVFIFTLLGNDLISQSQFYLSEVWHKDGGEMPIFYRNASTTDALRNVYVVGSTTNTATSNDILVQKFNRDGDLLWEHSFDGGANSQDMGTDVFVDNQLNVYVTGASTQSMQNNLDLVVLKYNSNGVLLWTYFYNFGGLPIPYDGGTAITGDNNGGIYVTGTSSGNGTMMDYITIKLNTDNGAHIWSNRYDYAQFNEAPNKIRFAGGHVFVTGASQVNLTPNKWELATVFYNSNSGALGGVRRSGGSSTEGMNEANDLTLDNQGNIYVLGATKNQNTGFDISLFKLNDDLDLVWEQHFDGYGADDKGFGVKTDDAGNIYAVGYVSHPSQGKNYAILKYNPQGDLIWSREFNGQANLDDEAVQLIVRGDRIFVTGAARDGANSNITTMGFTAEGDIFSVKTLDSPFGLNDKPTAMGIDLDDNLIVVAQVQSPGGAYRNITFKYNVFEKLLIPIYVDNTPSHAANQVIIRFDKTAMKYDVVNNKNFIAGQLKDFIQPNIITTMNATLPFDCGRLKTFKIYQGMSTSDSISISRLGDTIAVPDFWATLLVELPISEFETSFISVLSTMQPDIHYAELNHIYTFFSGEPNDPLYNIPWSAPYVQSGQVGLFNTSDNAAGINVESAWENFNQHGRDYVSVGVFDTGINWEHEDFGDGTAQGTKVLGGYDYFNGAGSLSQMYNTHDQHGHGTAIAGIIGALRNNEKGIAGIAGGDAENDNSGATLISMKIAEKNPNSTLPVFASTTNIVQAIADGSALMPNGGYGLNVLNLSFGSTFNSPTLRNIISFANKNGCLISVASGNYQVNTLQPYQNAILFPASYKDDWVMKVGASDFAPVRWRSLDGTEGSVIGNNLDFVAPGTPDLFRSLDFFNNSTYSYYGFGSSLAAPHVSGVAALMLSQHHPLNNTEYPNPLAPEDVENILKNTATHINTDWNLTSGQTLPQPNDYNGYGKINAEAAIAQITLPFRVEHYTYEVALNEFTAELIETNRPITLPEGIVGFANSLTSGQKYADVYKFELTFNHNSPNQVIAGWVRNSSCDLFGLEDVITSPHWSNVELVSFNQQSATLRGYVYNCKLSTTTTKWLPMDLNATAKFAFSLRTLDANPSVSIDKFENDEVVLFPNPAQNNFKIRFKNTSQNYPCSVSLYDATGKLVRQMEYTELFNNELKINTEDLLSGFYHCQIILSDRIYNKKVLIKNL